jgi:hypothetical protein
MKKEPTKNSDVEFVARLETLSDEVQLKEDEVDELLREAGIDAQASTERMLARVREVEQRQRAERFAKAEVERKAALERLGAPHARRSKAELLSRLAEIRSSLPPGDQPQAFYRGFETASEEDLESFVADLEELLSRGKS